MRKRSIRQVTIGGAARDMIVPAPAHRIVKQDALETMVRPHRPAALTREPRQDDAREVQPFGFERGAGVCLAQR